MKVKLTQICGVKGQLYGLDDEGRVWRYVPPVSSGYLKDPKEWAFWTKLTNHGRDPADKTKDDYGKRRKSNLTRGSAVGPADGGEQGSV